MAGWWGASLNQRVDYTVAKASSFAGRYTVAKALVHETEEKSVLKSAGLDGVQVGHLADV